MGVNFITENNEDELMNHCNFLKIYIIHSSNTKSQKEILEFILSKETIEKIKNNSKISSDDIPLIKKPCLHRSISELFYLKFEKKRTNLDKVENSLILVEYIPKEKDEEENLSIFH